MPKYAREKDKNQDVIAGTLERLGARVMDTHAFGRGFPDLLVEIAGDLLLVEVKNPDRHWTVEELEAEARYAVCFPTKYAVIQSIEQARGLYNGYMFDWLVPEKYRFVTVFPFMK